VKCHSCNKDKYQLHPFKSTLLVGTNLLLCQTCIDEKLEPRWVIILAGRQNGFGYARDFILKRRYVGREVLAEELMV